jgi:hypothetical protein
MATRDRLIRQYVAERHGPEVGVPSYWTLWRTWGEWFGPDGSRQRYARSAAAAPLTGRHVVVHRPGQVVALDTTVLPVKVREAGSARHRRDHRAGARRKGQPRACPQPHPQRRRRTTAPAPSS